MTLESRIHVRVCLHIKGMFRVDPGGDDPFDLRPLPGKGRGRTRPRGPHIAAAGTAIQDPSAGAVSLMVVKRRIL